MSDAEKLSRWTAGTAPAARGWCRSPAIQMPIQYEGIIAEHRWTRESAGLFDVSHMGQLIVAGATRSGLEACCRPTCRS
jgi:glycine cleavage system aminomethyltransferase T